LADEAKQKARQKQHRRRITRLVYVGKSSPVPGRSVPSLLVPRGTLRGQAQQLHPVILHNTLISSFFNSSAYWIQKKTGCE